MNQPNNPQNPDSLHVGETVDKLTDKLNKMHNSDFTGWSKDAKNGFLTAVISLKEWQQQLSEAGETNVSPRLYTHEQVLAFGEKVKELAIQSTLDYLHKNTTASIVYIDPYDYSCGVDGAEVDYFAETAEELIPELSIDLNKIEIK